MLDNIRKKSYILKKRPSRFLGLKRTATATIAFSGCERPWYSIIEAKITHLCMIKIPKHY